MATLIVYLGAFMTAAGQELLEIKYMSSADNTEQPAMFYAPDSKKATPLIVALHTWSGNYKQGYYGAIQNWCMKEGWAYIHPNFRGPNNRPEATGSEWAVKDIVSAIEVARKIAHIDDSSIYLVGASGGGHAALLMAGRHPELWAGVSAWVPISDLKAWYEQGRYVADIVKSCGGVPGASKAVDEEYRKRSPITYLANARKVPLHIDAGIHDGHTGSVPISQSLLAFNEVADPKDRLSEEDIRYFVEKEAVPPHLREEISDPSYGNNPPLFRRTSGHATVTLFEGGHELVAGAALEWIQSDYQSRKKHLSGKTE